MEIKRIKIENFKAIGSQELNFDGCSAFVTGGNNQGKSAALSGLIKRFQGEKPSRIVKQGEKNGYSFMELMDGSFIEWNFTEKTERFSFTTAEGLKTTSGVLKAIGKKYFGTRFDIDKFINSSPAAQIKDLQKLVGIDLTEIDGKLATAYENRTFANRTFSDVAARKVDKPAEEQHRLPIIINNEIKAIETENVKQFSLWNSSNDNSRSIIDLENKNLRENWRVENEKHLKEVQMFNATQRVFESEFNSQTQALSEIVMLCKNNSLDAFFNEVAAKEHINKLIKPQPEKPITSLPEPEYLKFTESEKPTPKTTTDLSAELETSRRYFHEYNVKLTQYDNWIKEGAAARTAKETANKRYDTLLAAKQTLIKTANMPEGFDFDENGILYDGFLLSDSQISTSKKYIAALKLGSMALGEVKALHFDASFLDNNSMAEVQDWANSQGLQLLIERPNFEGGGITYEIVKEGA